LRDGFSSGNLRLEGQKATATVLVSDIRGFTTISETEDSSLVMNWLNEYFGELVPVIAAHGGVVSKFEGDAVVAFFGVLPRVLTPQEGADQACQASLAMLEALDRLNIRRVERGDPPFISGIGLNTGPVTAGALGSADRLHYTVIGDTVNATARIEGLTRLFGVESSIVISQYTLFALADQHHKYALEGMGAHTVKGKAEQLLVYRLQSAKVKV
jgi:adenylate cyclase